MSRSRTRVPMKFTRHSSCKKDKAIASRRFRRGNRVWTVRGDHEAEPEPHLKRFIHLRDPWGDYLPPVIRKHEHTVWQRPLRGPRTYINWEGKLKMSDDTPDEYNDCTLCGPDRWKLWRK